MSNQVLLCRHCHDAAHAKRMAPTVQIDEHEEMDIVPANIDLLNAERELTIADLMAQVADREDINVDSAVLEPLATQVRAADMIGAGHAKDQLAGVLDAVEGDYNAIVVDAPPFYSDIFD